jgi:hypothetical protein
MNNHNNAKSNEFGLLQWWYNRQQQALKQQKIFKGRKSNAPKHQKSRLSKRTKRVLKPVPKGRAALVAKQKKARGVA